MESSPGAAAPIDICAGINEKIASATLKLDKVCTDQHTAAAHHSSLDRCALIVTALNHADTTTATISLQAVRAASHSRASLLPLMWLSSFTGIDVHASFPRRQKRRQGGQRQTTGASFAAVHAA